LLLVIPVCGLLGAFLAFRAFQGHSVASGVLGLLPTCLAVLFTYYALTGFSIEREFAKRSHDSAASLARTDWFKMGLIASWASFALALG
jgi:hypothetical protein